MTDFVPDHAGAEVLASPNFNARGGGLRPEILLLHYTGMESAKAAEDRLRDRAAEVSSHYLVHEDGRVVQMVREADRAWHAGRGTWRGCDDINSWSIGIEVVNGGHEHGLPPFPRRQIDALIGLCRGVSARHGIRPEMVLAHSDVAPGRKVDPGERFPWGRLHRAGVGHLVRASPRTDTAALGPGDAGSGVSLLQSQLSAYGYGLSVTGVYDDETRKVVDAFQRHFRPARIDGVADAGTRRTLARLLASPGITIP
jgi:N-acetylmuramoyl-L-alanine amidase